MPEFIDGKYDPIPEETPTATGGWVHVDVLGERRPDDSYPVAVTSHQGYTHRQVLALLTQATVAYAEYVAMEEEFDEGFEPENLGDSHG